MIDKNHKKIDKIDKIDKNRKITNYKQDDRDREAFKLLIK